MGFINNIVIVHSWAIKDTVKENLVINRDIAIKFKNISMDIIVVILDTREVVHTVKDSNKH